MARLDPALQRIHDSVKERRLATSRATLHVEEFAIPDPKVRVLLHFSNDLAPAEAIGFEVTSVAGDVAAGFIPHSSLDQLEALAGISIVECARPFRRELMVSTQITHVDQIRAGNPGADGSGVLIGLVDSGIDVRHQSFRAPDGRLRILAVWDQGLTPEHAETSPAAFGYGVEYLQDALEALSTTPVPARILDRDGHGTQVAGIAAGSGSPSGLGRPKGTFRGIAPGADLLVVATRNAERMGDSADVLDALVYLQQRARDAGRPIVINISQGNNIGPHDGTSLLERAIDHLLGGPGIAIVKSAGNAAADGIHARGRIAKGGVAVVPFSVGNGDREPDVIDIWYGSQARLEVTIQVGNQTTVPVVPNAPSTTIRLPNGNDIFIASTTNDPFNQSNRIYLELSTGAASQIKAGRWKIRLRETAQQTCKFDAWIERGGAVPRFLPPYVTNEGTITIPGTSHQIITVGAFVTVPKSDSGSYADFSSRGPTRDGRAAPHICAPGKTVTAACVMDSGPDPYRPMGAGTSAAAPHVAGLIALLFQKNGLLTQTEIQKLLRDSAIVDAQTGTTPNMKWGAGKLDAFACWSQV